MKRRYQVKQTLNRAVRIVCAVLLLAALLLPDCAPMADTVQAVTQSDIDKLKQDAKSLSKRQSELKSSLADLRNDRSKAIQRRNLLDQQISTTEQEIVNTETQISGYEALLSQTMYELEENRQTEAETYALFCRRARAMEEGGVPSFWSVLFDSVDFSDLLSRLSDVQVVIDYDQSVLNNLRTIQTQIEDKQAYQENLKSEAEAAKVKLEQQKQELAAQRQEANELVKELQANVEANEAILKEIDAEEERIQKEILKKTEELAAQMNWSSSVGGYIWPLTSSRRITSNYGGRNTGIKGASLNHKGVDIGGVGYNSKVLAAKAGIVVTSAYSSSYGNYVVISHGAGNTTLYAHMSSRSVKEGDRVNQGQVIGVTGSTGISSGPHLHYEIVENGSRVDPKKYLPGYIQAW
ncbi:MAG: peptidoglycan DD-metalloendopeptidase family protein [Oscillospiraceae bacterium]|nr:peptidoglycan DD-metalloendopeptidase family protein [Oscillospiraceae bacterium]